MTKIVVLVKQVPDTYSERKLSDSDHTLDRESADAVLDEINEKAVEEALKIKEAGEGEVTVISVGPDRATDAIRKALSMGADRAIHVSDAALHGSDVIATASPKLNPKYVLEKKMLFRPLPSAISALEFRTTRNCSRWILEFQVASAPSVTASQELEPSINVPLDPICSCITGRVVSHFDPSRA